MKRGYSLILIDNLAIEHAMRITDTDSDVLRLINSLHSKDDNQKKLKALIGKLIVKQNLPKENTPLIAILNNSKIARNWRDEVGVKPGSLYDELTHLESLLEIKLDTKKCIYQRLEEARAKKENFIS